MLASRRLVPVVLAFLILTQAGCTKVKDEQTFDLPAHGEKLFVVDEQKSEMKLTVEVTASDAPVSGRLFEGETEEGKVLDENKDSQQFTLSATVPAGQKTAVWIGTGAKPTNVNVKILGK